MKRYLLLCSVMGLIIIGMYFVYGLEGNASQINSNYEVNSMIGDYPSPNKEYVASLIHAEGDRIDLVVKDNAGKQISPKVADVTSMTWYGNNAVIFSTSPVYGCLIGIQLFNCSDGTVRQIVSAKEYSKEYPSGMSYYKVIKIIHEEEDKVVFVYYPDINNLTWTKSVLKRNIYIVNMNGTNSKEYDISDEELENIQ